jgi:hypothetical protein
MASSVQSRGIRRHRLLDLTFLVVDDELVLDELLVLLDLFFLSSSSSSSSSFFVGVDGARFGVDSRLRVSVRVLVISRFGFICVLGFVCVLLSRVLLVGVCLTLRSGSRRLDEVDRVLAGDLVLLLVLLVRVCVSTRFAG